MKVIILAGGKGTRLSMSTRNIPKPLVRIRGKTILDYQIEFLESQGFSDIRFSLGYRFDSIIDHLWETYPKRYEWVIEREPLGTGGALKFATRDLKESFLAFNIDDFPKINLQDFIEFHQNHPVENSIAVYQVKDARDFGLIEHENGIIRAFLEKPKEKRSGLINIGLYILRPEIFKNFSQQNFSLEKDVFPILAKERKIAVYNRIMHWFTVGTEERLSEAKNNFKKYFLERSIWQQNEKFIKNQFPKNFQDVYSFSETGI